MARFMRAAFCDLSTALLRRGYGIRFRATGHSMQPTTPIDLASRRATWLQAARADAAPVLRWMKPTALLLALAIGGLVAVPETQAGDFGYRKPIAINRAQVGTATAPPTLANYPMLYSVTDVNLKTFAIDPANGRIRNTNGLAVPNTKPYDLIFRALDATTCNDGNNECTLDHEIESYDPATGKLVAWVRIPVLNTQTASSDTTIYIYYGATTITASTECLPPFTNCTGVWDANFKGVWHLKEDPSGTAPQIKDSTSNANHGTSAGAMTSADQVDAKVDKGLDFDGADDKISIPDSGVLNFGSAGNFSISLWVKPTGTQTQFDRILAKQDQGSFAGKAGYYLNYDLNNTYGAGISDGGGTSCSDNTCPGIGRTLGSEWNHIVMVVDRPGARLRTYLNGVLDLDSAIPTGPTGVQSIDNTQPLAFAAASTGTLYNPSQVLDEVRISNVVRSADWIKTEYNNVTASGGIRAPGWSAVSGSGLTQYPEAMAVYNGELYIAGGFTDAAGIPACDTICRWNGSAWSSVGGAAVIFGTPRALAVYKGELYVGGSFIDSGGGATNCDRICRWNGSSWNNLGGNDIIPDSEVNALAVYNDELYVGGSFVNGGGGINNCDSICRWNGSSWSDVGGRPINNNSSTVYAFAIYNNELYMGGDWTTTTPGPGQRLARWNGSTWNNVGGNTAIANVDVRALTVYNGQLYVGGGFSDAGGVGNCDKLCRWNGSAWSDVGGNAINAGSSVYALAVYNGELYVGGVFLDAGVPSDPDADYIAKWTGSAWSDVGGVGLSSYVYALAVYNGSLYVEGSFTDAAGITTADYIATWTGNSFYTVGTELSNPPSLARLTHARALAHDGVQTRVVELRWRTSFEADHLGFHVYREEQGARTRITPSLIAGSALKTRTGTVLTAGQSYSWWDVLPLNSGPLRYWLEEIDLKGRRTWHGPIDVQSAKGHKLAAEPERVRSVVLNRQGRSKASVTAAPWYGPRQVSPATPTEEQLAVQWKLAASVALKLGVQAEGWYRVSQSDLVAAGLDSRVNPRHLQLFADGVEVPLLVTGEHDGRFDPSDAIEFYGLGLDTSWTDTRTYWLVAGSEAGKRVGGAPSRQTGSLAPLSFPFTLEWRPRLDYWAAILNGEGDNYFGPFVSAEPVEQDLVVTQLDPAAPGEARLEVTLQGVTDVVHQVAVQLNGHPVGTLTWSGQTPGTTTISLPQAGLQAGANRLTLVAAGGEMDYSVVAVARLTYWHLYHAEEDVLEAAAQGGEQLTLSGFSSAQIRVLDVTEPDAVLAVPGHVKPEQTGFAVTVVAPGSGNRTLLAFTDGRQARAASIQFNHPSQWHARGHGADLVILTHASLLPSLTPLQLWRETQGWQVALIDVQDVYDEFNFGAKSPWALRAFLKQAHSQWARRPRFLLLAGDASFDPRNFMGMGDMDLVPTKLVDTQYLETASDDWFGDLDEDGVPEIAVGRLAVQTSEQAAAVVQKLIAYDRAGAGDHATVLVADHDEGFDFEGASGQVKALLPTDATVEEIYRGRMDDAAAHAAVLASLQRGAWLLNYMGHGSVEVWLGGVLSSEDARALTTTGRLPFVVAMTCLNGFFHDIWSESLAETLQKNGQGGAVAVWASSALTEPAAQAPMNQALVRKLGEGVTVGEATAQAKAATSDRDVRRTWILFGDPTTRLH